MEMMGELSVVAMATGTKCVGEKDRGMFVVSDSHAEVLSLRLFRLFLLYEMSGCGEGCLVRDGDKFIVRPGVSFHFYSSCVMCGDATICIPLPCNTTCDNNTYHEKLREQSNSGLKRPPTSPSAPSAKQIKPDKVALSSSPTAPLSKQLKPDKAALPSSPAAPLSKHPQSGDMTRSGGKCLLSDDLTADSIQTRSWSVTSVLRTKPGRGPLSLSLSCSDKLMKRQSLGLQGGLLAGLIPNPIRFKCIVIGGNFSINSVKRALFARLPEQFQFEADVISAKDLFLNSFENCTSRLLNNAPVSASSTSLLWCRGGAPCQWSAVKGRLQGATKTSAEEKVMLPVCRANMFKFAKSVAEVLIPGNEYNVNESGQEHDMRDEYENFKKLSPYREKKNQFCAHFMGWKRKKERGKIVKFS